MTHGTAEPRVDAQAICALSITNSHGNTDASPLLPKLTLRLGL
jgi:hypothetical protein